MSLFLFLFSLPLSGIFNGFAAPPLPLPCIPSFSHPSRSWQRSFPVVHCKGDRYRVVFPHCATSAIYSHRLILQPPLSGVNNLKLCHWDLLSAAGDKSTQSSLSVAIIFNPFFRLRKVTGLSLKRRLLFWEYSQTWCGLYLLSVFRESSGNCVLNRITSNCGFKHCLFLNSTCCKILRKKKNSFY